MVGYDSNNNALTLGDSDSISVGDYELEYNADDDEWQARYSQPIGGDVGIHGDINGAIYDNESQIGGHSLRFDGVDDWVSIGQLDTSAPLSISTWIKADSFDNEINRIVSKYASSSPGAIALDVSSSGELRIFTSDDTDNDVSLTSNTNLNAGQWYHLVAVVDPSSELQLYIDGSLDASSTVSYSLLQNTMGWAIGEDDFKGQRENEFWNGLIDDVRIFNKALSASEVTDLFNGVDIRDSLVAQYDFEYPETQIAIDGTGEPYPKNRVPRSTNGSLVPQGLAESISAGEVLADDGNTYTSVQTAVDNAAGWVLVGPGTFNENITISTTGLTLEGVGYGSVINGGDTGDAITAGAPYITISDLAVSTNETGSGNNCIRVEAGTNDVTVENIVVTGADGRGVSLDGGNSHTVSNVIVNGTGRAIYVDAERSIVQNCAMDDNNNGARLTADDCIVVNNNASNATYGFVLDSNDCIVRSNRAYNISSNGIFIYGTSTDNIVANNRVPSVADNGSTGTVFDNNLSGN